MPNTLLENLQTIDALETGKKSAVDSALAILAKLKTENRTVMSAEEQTAFEAKRKEAEDLQQTIEATRSAQRLAATVAAGTGTGTGTGTAGSGVRPAVYTHENWIDKPWGYEARTNETAQERRRRVEVGAGEFLKCVMQAEHRSSARPVDSRLLALNGDFERRAQAAGSSEQVSPDGGFLVYPDFAQEILMLAHDTGLVHPLTRKLPLSEFTNALKIPAIDEQSRKDGSRWGGVQAFWEGEAASLVGSKPTFALIDLITKKLTGLYYATSEVLSDARLLGSVALQAFGEEFGFKLDDGCIRGTGAGQMLGILNAPCLVTVSKETGQAAATVVFENIKKMWSRVWNRSRANAVWFIEQDVEQQLFGLSQTVGTGGVPVYLPPGMGGGVFGGASASPYGMLFGRPVITIEQCATTGTVGDVILADFGQYLMVDKGDMQTATSIHVRFLTDENTFRYIYRCDGQPWWKTALTPFSGTSSQSRSPFVVLQSR